MDNDRPLALDGSRWWTKWQGTEPVRGAFSAAVLFHWAELVVAVKENNEKNKVYPSTFSDIARAAGLDYQKLNSRITGKYAATLEDALSFAYVIGKTPADFFPQERTQVILTIARLSCAISESDCGIYASFYLECLNRPMPIAADRFRLIDDAFRIKDEKSRQIIMSVANRLEPFLKVARMRQKPG